MAQMEIITMSDEQTFSVRLDYGQSLWWDDWDYHTTVSLNEYTIGIGPLGPSLSFKHQLTKEEKVDLVKSLSGQPAPHWQHLPLNLYDVIVEISNKALRGSQLVDSALRNIPKCYRLPRSKFDKFLVNNQPHCSTIRWYLSDQDKLDVAESMPAKDKQCRVVTENIVHLPFPEYFDRKQTHITNEESKEIERSMLGQVETNPSKIMFAEAYAKYTELEFKSSVLLLCTSMEIGIKAFISERSDSISSYLLNNLQSPPVENLLELAIKYCGLNVPKQFKEWVKDLRVRRNSIAHKPKQAEVGTLELARWISISEAILAAIDGHEVDELIGQLVKPTGEKAKTKFKEESMGVVLRRESYREMPDYHILMDTGVTWRIKKDSFSKLKDQALRP
jgi:hypothetical protein